MASTAHTQPPRRHGRPAGLSFIFFYTYPSLDVTKHTADVRSYDVVGVLWKRRGGMGRYALGGCVGVCQSGCMRAGRAAIDGMEWWTG